jgi:hypothetical protein
LVWWELWPPCSWHNRFGPLYPRKQPMSQVSLFSLVCYFYLVSNLEKKNDL